MAVSSDALSPALGGADALEDFFGWWTAQGQPPFTRTTVQAWRAALGAKGLAPASIKQKLSAVRKLAVEAAYNGLLDPAAAQAKRSRLQSKLAADCPPVCRGRICAGSAVKPTDCGERTPAFPYSKFKEISSPSSSR